MIRFSFIMFLQALHLERQIQLVGSEVLAQAHPQQVASRDLAQLPHHSQVCSQGLGNRLRHQLG
jgi:hypothetical protein